MLRLIRNNDPYTVIILFIFTLVVKMNALMHPEMPAMPQGHFLYENIVNALNYFLHDSAFGFTMLAVIMLFFQGLYLNRIVYKYKMFGKPAQVITFIYIILSSLSREYSYFSVLLLVNWCLIASLDILTSLHQTQHPRKHIFNAGFLLGIAFILHFPALVYLVLLFIALSLLRSLNAGEWVVGFLGYFTAVYFFIGILFLVDALPVIKNWPVIGLSVENIGNPLYMTVVIIGIAVLLVCGLVVLQQQLGRIGIFMRRNWVIVIVCLVLSTFVSLATPVFMRNEWLAIIPALSLIIAHPFYLEKNKVFSNFAFYFSLLLVIVSQLTY